jgi:t-SNARE complex subunit (syntaxin)
LRELESRLKEQILGQRARISNKSQTSTDKQALLKLERDFERVQTTVQVTKNKVTKQMKQYQRADSARRDEELAAVAASSANCSHYNSTQNILQQQQLQLQQDRLQEEIMREREDEIRAINKGMHQVNEIYKDLAHIVGEQQDDVDQIENKMEESKTAAQSGLEQVSKANEKYGGSGANANCIIS